MGEVIKIKVLPATYDGQPFDIAPGPPLTARQLMDSQPELPDIAYVPVSPTVAAGITQGLYEVALGGDAGKLFLALRTKEQMDNLRHLAEYLAVMALRGGSTEESAARVGAGVFRLLSDGLSTRSPGH